MADIFLRMTRVLRLVQIMRRSIRYILKESLHSKLRNKRMAWANRYLLGPMLGQAAAVGFPVPAFVGPHWGVAEEAGVLLVRGIAAVPGRWNAGTSRMVLVVPWCVCVVR